MNAINSPGSGLQSSIAAMIAQIQQQAQSRVASAEQQAGLGQDQDQDQGQDLACMAPASMAGQARQPFAAHNKAFGSDPGGNVNQTTGVAATSAQTVNGVTNTAPTSTGGGGQTNIATGPGSVSKQTVNGVTTTSTG